MGTIAMFCKIIAATAMTLITVSAQAEDSIEVMGSSARPNSVSYVGYDSFDANGNPICTPCLVQRAEEAARLKAYAERRERSRQYMARLQGNDIPASSNSLVAADAAPLVPAPENTIADVSATPLRAGVQ